MLIQQLTDIVKDAFGVDYAPEYGVVTSSDRPDLCQFQCNGAFGAAKAYRTAPIKIAQAVAAILQQHPMIQKAEAVNPGFINITVTDDCLTQTIKALQGDPRFGIPTQPRKKIMVDYGGANVAKPLHVGHLRPAIIGECLVRMARYMGHEVIGDAHLGDWGLQMGLTMAQLLYPDALPDDAAAYACETLPGVTKNDLNVIYPGGSARSKADAEFRTLAQKITMLLQEGHAGYRKLWRHLVDVSIPDIRLVYNRLGVDFDLWLGESDVQDTIAPLVAMLKEQGLVRESDGALVMDVVQDSDIAPMPPVLITKSDGAALYATTDIATIAERMREHNPDEIWYVTDNRQALHFEQVFRASRKAGFVPNTALGFYPNGTMNGTDGKPYKTREGGIMPLSDFIDTLCDAAKEKLQNVEGDTDVIAEQIGVAALKFGDLINDRAKDYIFDIDRFVAFEGKTGPYVQYCAVRIASLLRKADEQGLSRGDIVAESESARDLILHLDRAGDMMLAAIAGKLPSVICDYIYELAAAFNRFYIAHKIVTEPDETLRGSRLSLSAYVCDVLTTLCGVVGIEIPERM